MVNLLWANLSAKQKEYVRSFDKKLFILGGIYVNQEQFEKLIKEYISKDFLVIIGNLLDKYIPKLEDSKPFKVVKRETKIDSERLFSLDYYYNDTKYIIRELKPSKIIGFNGSWSDCLHFNSFYWEAIKVGAEFQSLSPFKSEDEAKNYCLQFKDNFDSIIGQRFNADELKKLTLDISKLSWDWTGQTGALLTDSALKVISYGFNEIMPYQSTMMHNGSLKEREHGEIGKNIELLETIHAEMATIINANFSLKDTTLWVSKFPCPYCARVIAKSKIRKVMYVNDYSNESSYSILADKI